MTPRVVGEVGVDLRRHVAALAAQARHLDVNAAGARRHAEHARPERLLLRVKPERALDRGDAVAERQQLEHVAS